MFHERMQNIEKDNFCQPILPHPYCISLEVKPNGENASDIITGRLFQALRVPLPKFFSATSWKRQNTGTQRFSHYLKTYLFLRIHSHLIPVISVAFIEMQKAGSLARPASAIFTSYAKAFHAYFWLFTPMLGVFRHFYVNISHCLW